MNLKAIQQLAKTNLIYATPPLQIANYRKKQAKNPSDGLDIPKKIFHQQLLIGGLYIFLFVLMGSLNGQVGKSSSLFANLIALFSVFTVAQSFVAFYNVFYESKDLPAYRPYAFRESEIILGKSVSVVVTALMGLGPLIGYFVVFPFQAEAPMWVTLPLMVVNLGLLLVVLALFTFVVAHFLTRIPLFRRFKDVIANVLLTVISGMSGLLYVMMNQWNSQMLVRGTMHAIIPPFEWLYAMMVRPLSVQGLLGYAFWGGSAMLLLAIVYYRALPHFYDSAVEVSHKTVARARVRDMQLGKSSHAIGRYQRSLLKDASVWTQVVFPATILPYLFVLPFFLELRRNPTLLQPYVQVEYLLPMVLTVGLIAFLNSAGSNLTSIAFSLERENFDYLRVLAVDSWHYVKTKFVRFFCLQSVLPILCLGGIGWMIQVPPMVLGALLVTWGAMSFAFSAWSYTKDFRERVTNWSNIVELQNRYRRFEVMILVLLLLIIIAALVTVIYVVLMRTPSIVGRTVGILAWGIGTIAALLIGFIVMRGLREEVRG